MKAIYASKLYRTSPRKSEIRAAIQDPVNAELVQQLRKYLDDEYIKPEYLDRDYKKEVPKQPDENGQTDVVFDNAPAPSAPSRAHSAPPPSGPSPDLADEHADELAELDEERGAVEEMTEELEDTDAEQSSDAEISESTSVSGTSIAAACCGGPCVDADVIKGTLNARQDCAGVVRISLKNNCSELWIYYNDNINLNNIMEPVISFLESAGYSHLVFNRLARTDNAIVFEISAIPQTPVEEVTE